MGFCTLTRLTKKDILKIVRLRKEKYLSYKEFLAIIYQDFSDVEASSDYQIDFIKIIHDLHKEGQIHIETQNRRCGEVIIPNIANDSKVWFY